MGDRAGRRATRQSIRRSPATSTRSGIRRRSASPRSCCSGSRRRPRAACSTDRRPAARRHRDSARRRADRAVRQRPALRLRPGGSLPNGVRCSPPAWPGTVVRRSMSSSCCGPIATASCRPSRASIAACVLAQPVVGVSGHVEGPLRVEAGIVRVRRSLSARPVGRDSTRRLPATGRRRPASIGAAATNAAHSASGMSRTIRSAAVSAAIGSLS